MENKETILSEKEDAQSILDLVRNTMQISSINMIQINQYLKQLRELDPKLGYYLSGQYYFIQALYNPNMTTYFEIGLDYLQKASDLEHQQAKIILKSIR